MNKTGHSIDFSADHSIGDHFELLLFLLKWVFVLLILPCHCKALNVLCFLDQEIQYWFIFLQQRWVEEEEEDESKDEDHGGNNYEERKEYNHQIQLLVQQLQ